MSEYDQRTDESDVVEAAHLESAPDLDDDIDAFDASDAPEAPEAEPEPSDPPDDVDPADAHEQALVVEYDEDDYR